MAGYIASEFERFKAVCLQKHTPPQIADARLLFYSGAIAAVDAMNKAIGTGDVAALFKNMESVLDECIAFKEEVQLQVQKRKAENE